MATSPKDTDRSVIDNDKTLPFPSPDGFKPEPLPVVDSSVSYTAPEFLASGSRMTFVDPQRCVWVVELDSKSGVTRSKTGQALFGRQEFGSVPALMEWSRVVPG